MLRFACAVIKWGVLAGITFAVLTALGVKGSKRTIDRKQAAFDATH